MNPPASPRAPLAAKVPELIGGAIGVLGFVFALRLQLRQREYPAPVYWFAVMMVAIFGTMVADVLKDGTGVSYAVTTPVFAALTAFVFGFLDSVVLFAVAIAIPGLAWLLVFVALVAYTAATKRDIQPRPAHVQVDLSRTLTAQPAEG